MRKMLLALALTLPALTTVHAIASQATDAMAPVHQFVEGFNKLGVGPEALMSNLQSLALDFSDLKSTAAAAAAKFNPNVQAQKASISAARARAVTAPTTKP